MLTIHHRFDHQNDEELARHLDFIRRLPLDNKLVVLENKSTTGQAHTHAIYSVDGITFSTARQRWKKVFPGHLDKAYQMKVIPEGELTWAENYLCKANSFEDQLELLLSTGKYVPDYIQARHVEYWEHVNKPTKTMNDHLNGRVVHQHFHELVKPAKKKKPNFFEQVIEHLERQHPEREWKVRDSKIMLEALYKMHGANFRPWGPQQLVNECRVLLAHFCYKEFYTDAMEEALPLAHWLR